MAANTKTIYEVLPVNAAVTFVNADGTSKKSILTGQASANAAGTRVDSVMISSDDTANRDLAFYITIGGTDYYIGNVSVPLGSGYTTVIRVEGMNVLSPYLRYLALAPSAILKANMVVAVTAAKTVTVLAMGGDY